MLFHLFLNVQTPQSEIYKLPSKYIPNLAHFSHLLPPSSAKPPAFLAWTIRIAFFASFPRAAFHLLLTETLEVDAGITLKAPRRG